MRTKNLEVSELSVSAPSTIRSVPTVEFLPHFTVGLFYFLGVHPSGGEYLRGGLGRKDRASVMTSFDAQPQAPAFRRKAGASGWALNEAAISN